MRITKLVHSCLLVEHEGKRAIVDPGNYSNASGLIEPALLADIDYVLITHEHQDHFDEDFVRSILQHSPNALWFSPGDVAQKLNSYGISQANTHSSLSDVRFITSDHTDGRPWFKHIPEHTSYVLFSSLLISGDHQAFTSMHGATILAGAFTAPWGSLAAGARMIERMEERPDTYIPIHDWHLNETHRQAAYTQAGEVFGEFGVTVVHPVDGVAFDIKA